jgi:hypothetical protein
MRGKKIVGAVTKGKQRLEYLLQKIAGTLKLIPTSN